MADGSRQDLRCLGAGYFAGGMRISPTCGFCNPQKPAAIKGRTALAWWPPGRFTADELLSKLGSTENQVDYSVRARDPLDLRAICWTYSKLRSHKAACAATPPAEHTAKEHLG